MNTKAHAKTSEQNQKAASHKNKQSSKGTSRSEQREVSVEELDLKGLPPLNLGALFMPPIWGPAHGIWITILYYPVWLLADNLFYGVYVNPTLLTVVLAVVAALILAAVTIVFARASQVYALRRDLQNGKTKEQYRKRQIAWAIGMGVIALVMIIAATYYNLVIRPTLGA